GSPDLLIRDQMTVQKPLWHKPRELGHRNVTTATAGTRADPPSARARSEQVKAMTEEQIAVFLPDARKLLGRDLTALFVLLAETGLRIGEALALRMGSACSSGRSSRRTSRFTAFVTPTRRSASLPARMSTKYPGSWGTLRRSSRWTPTHGGCRAFDDAQHRLGSKR